MTLPVGTISLSGVNVELRLSSTQIISLNDANVRQLAGVPSGAISMSNLQGKSYVISIPASGSITQYFGLSYAYGNPSVLSWTVSGSTFSFNISSSTTYCGPPFSSSGTSAITETTVGGYVVQTTTFTNNHPKVCCNGNQNYIYETYTLTMNYPNTAVLTATSSNGSQTGC